MHPARALQFLLNHVRDVFPHHAPEVAEILADLQEIKVPEVVAAPAPPSAA